MLVGALCNSNGQYNKIVKKVFLPLGYSLSNLGIIFVDHDLWSHCMHRSVIFMNSPVHKKENCGNGECPIDETSFRQKKILSDVVYKLYISMNNFSSILV